MQTKILILGGGYAGLQAALELSSQGYPCSLLDRNDFHELLPELPHIITDSKLSTKVPFTELLSGKPVEFVQGTAQLVDYKNKQVTLQDGRMLPFEYLVLALGSSTNYFNISGLSDHSIGFITTAQVHQTIDRLNEKFAQASSFERNSPQYKRCLSVVIGGGGLTGVEVAGELLHILPKLCKQHNVPCDDVRIHLVEAMSTLLPGGDTVLSERVTQFFRNRQNIVLHFNVPIKEAMADAVVMADGTVIEAGTILWTGGVRSNVFYDKNFIDANGDSAQWPKGRGFRLEVDEVYRLKGCPRTYAVGDNALTLDPETGRPIPPNGQAAYKQGKFVARNIIADINNESPKPKPLKLAGVLVSLGPVQGAGTITYPLKVNMPVSPISRKIKKLVEMRYKYVDIRR